MSCGHRSWAILLLIVFVAALSRVSFAAEPVEMLLWPEGAPGALGEEPKDKPKFIAYLPEADKATGAAVVICPGGGYGGLAMDHEGHQIGRWLNSFGVAGFIVDYRHRGKGYGHPAPLQDAQRAIRTVRSRAKEWNVKPDRIGILGFSAGGHLASTAATHFDDGSADAKDTIDKAGCRPDFAILCYPVIAFGETFTHTGSQRNLIGDGAAPELVKLLSNEKQVTDKTPPTFLWHTTEDTGVLPDNSAQFYLACVRNKVPAELHIYEKGRHGVGLGKGIAGTENWPTACQTWMEARGLLAK
jgi:acetyl esterase/lipase